MCVPHNAGPIGRAIFIVTSPCWSTLTGEVGLVSSSHLFRKHIKKVGGHDHQITARGLRLPRHSGSLIFISWIIGDGGVKPEALGFSVPGRKRRMKTLTAAPPFLGQWAVQVAHRGFSTIFCPVWSRWRRIFDTCTHRACAQSTPNAGFDHDYNQIKFITMVIDQHDFDYRIWPFHGSN